MLARRLLFAIWIAPVLALVAVAGARAETLSFPTLGFQIEMPDGWRLLSRSEEFQVAVGVDLGSDLINRKAQDVERTSRLAVVVRDEINPRVNPGIFLDVHPGRVGDIEGGLRNVERALRGNTLNFVSLSPPRRAKLGGYDAGRISYRYEVTAAIGSLRVEETFWLVPMGDRYLTISSGVEAGRDAAAQKVIADAARSLRSLAD